MFLGRKQWPSVIDLSKQPADMVISAEQPLPQPNFYRQILLHDLNNDGFDDIIVGAWGKSYGMFSYDQEGPWDTGWIVTGRAKLPSELRLGLIVGSPSNHGGQERNSPNVLEMAPSEGEVFFGAGMVIGDVTGDGIKDLILNVFKKNDRDKEIRRPCLLAGREDFFAIQIGNLFDRCQFISGDSGLDTDNPYSTKPLFIGDFNGDRRDDVFLRLADPEFVIKGLLGRPFTDPRISFASNETVSILPSKSKNLTYPIFTQMILGDINGDQCDDLLMVEPLGGKEEKGQIGPGAVHVVFGRELVTKKISETNISK